MKCSIYEKSRAVGDRNLIRSRSFSVRSFAQSLILVYCGNRGNRLFSFVVTSRALAGIADVTEITEFELLR